MDMCTSPNKVFYTGLKTESGKDLLYFDCHYPSPEMISVGYAEKRLKVHIPPDPEFVRFVNGEPFLYVSKQVPCGKCDQDVMVNAKKWSQRVLMEIGPNADRAIFLTLTFDERFCPGKVDRRDLQLFMKRLRRVLDVPGIRFFGCGEYGEKGSRPHYHVVIWNLPPMDLVPSVASPGALESPVIRECWPYGMHVIEPVTPRSVAYVARYTAKKTGSKRGFLAMSTHPGIGRDFLVSHQATLGMDYIPLACDGTVVRVNPPRYAEKVLPDLDWSSKKDKRVWNAERSRGMLGYFHGLEGTRLDDYLRNLYAGKHQRLEKKGI